jgi:hypothetical protein
MIIQSALKQDKRTKCPRAGWMHPRDYPSFVIRKFLTDISFFYLQHQWASTKSDNWRFSRRPIWTPKEFLDSYTQWPKEKPLPQFRAGQLRKRMTMRSSKEMFMWAWWTIHLRFNSANYNLVPTLVCRRFQV